jgi:hypothetical protein
MESLPFDVEKDSIFIHKFAKSKLIDAVQDKNKPIILTGEQGYRTAIASHGITGRDHGVFYYEVTFLQPKTPMPFINIKSAIRVGVC